MIRIILAAALLAVPTDTAAQMTQIEQTELCSQIGGIAELVMKHRQEGISQSEARTIWLGSLRKHNAIPEMVTMVLTVLKKAYERPQFSTQLYRQREVTRFRDQMESICYSLETQEDAETSDEQLWIGDT